MGSKGFLSVLILLLLFACLPLNAQLNSCGPGGSSVSDSLAKAWKRIQAALEFEKPREVQRLVAIRLKILSLATAKKTLIGNVKTIVDVGSTPAWLKTRVEAIPQMQKNIEDLMSDIEQEARQGGLLAGERTLRLLQEVLGAKRSVTLCELSRVPFPLPADQLPNLKSLLHQLEDEARSLDDIDAALSRLIQDAQKQNR